MELWSSGSGSESAGLKWAAFQTGDFLVAYSSPARLELVGYGHATSQLCHEVCTLLQTIGQDWYGF